MAGLSRIDVGEDERAILKKVMENEPSPIGDWLTKAKNVIDVLEQHG